MVCTPNAKLILALTASRSHTNQDREYGIGWGHRDLEYRRTTVTVESIDDDHVCFCVMGLRSYREGYYVHLSISNANSQATCLVDWLRANPHDVEPSV